jgi:hypothetical protein
MGVSLSPDPLRQGKRGLILTRMGLDLAIRRETHGGIYGRAKPYHDDVITTIALE